MNEVNRGVGAPGPESPELGQLLTAYFHAERPRTWPAWRPPPSQAPRRRPTPLLALAASLLLFLVGGLWLASAYPTLQVETGTASRTLEARSHRPTGRLTSDRARGAAVAPRSTPTPQTKGRP